MRIQICILILSLPFILFSQETLIDSLEKSGAFFQGENNFNNQIQIDSIELLAAQSDNDTSLINYLNQMAGMFDVNYHEKVFEYGEKALGLSKKLKYTKGIADSYVSIGRYYWRRDYKQAF